MFVEFTQKTCDKVQRRFVNRKCALKIWLYVNSVDCAMQCVLTNVLTSQLSREILAVHVVQQLGHLLHVEDVKVVEVFIHQLAFTRDK